MNFKKTYLVLALAALGTFSACSPDEAGAGNGLNLVEADASFTVTQVDANHFKLTATESPELMSSRWGVAKADLADAIPTAPGVNFNAFLPDAGTYKVIHTATGKGGTTTMSTQLITVTTPDPIAGNLILGSEFNSVDDYNQFSILHIPSSGTAAWAYDATGKKATISGTNGHQGIFQAVNVIADKHYKIDMTVSGTGSTNTWFELYASMTAPTQNQDYSFNGKRMQINTWAGCGTSNFSGLFSAVQCGTGDVSGNVVSFPTSGTAYIVVKCGGDNIGSISIDNVEMRRID
ncbi:hypothetical protein [Flavobacterium sp. 3HN19-14]|uniref:hypothetical protein n=1 Tax=Flavobacterium sp. 3HN19-14 TaxID=3448133 RepID=UPI003EE1738E